jgi:hypothetical protein
MASASWNKSDRISRASMGAFVGFFAAPAVVVPTLILFRPDLIDYANAGLVLLISVGVGAVVGCIFGATIDALALRGLSKVSPLAVIAGGISGCTIGWLSMGSNRLAGAMTGTVVGAIAGGILGLTRVESPGVTFLSEPDLWDRDLDS